MSTDSDYIELRRFAVKFKPATLVIEYKNLKSNKTVLKKIKFKKVDGKSAEEITNALIKKHIELRQASVDQLHDLVSLIMSESVNDTSFASDDSGILHSTHDAITIDKYGDLNKAPDVSLPYKASCVIYAEYTKFAPLRCRLSLIGLLRPERFH
jgi:hypothetical protein